MIWVLRLYENNYFFGLKMSSIVVRDQGLTEEEVRKIAQEEAGAPPEHTTSIVTQRMIKDNEPSYTTGVWFGPFAGVRLEYPNVYAYGGGYSPQNYANLVDSSVNESGFLLYSNEL